MNQTDINKNNLALYVQENGFAQKGGIVFQYADYLIESGEKGEMEQLANTIQNSKIEIVTKQEALDTVFHELADWSTESDILLYLSEGAMICIQKSDIHYFI